MVELVLRHTWTPIGATVYSVRPETCATRACILLQMLRTEWHVSSSSDDRDLGVIGDNAEMATA